MEDNRERQNALETERLNIQVRISMSDRAALDYIKSLPGFAEAYPEYAADFVTAAAEEATVEESLGEWEFHIGEPVAAGEVVIRNGVRYTVLQGHTLQEDWAPGEVPALYRREQEPSAEGGYPDWVQPTGAHDAYSRGAKVKHNGKDWESDVDANVWEPGAAGTEALWHEI